MVTMGALYGAYRRCRGFRCYALDHRIIFERRAAAAGVRRDRRAGEGLLPRADRSLLRATIIRCGRMEGSASPVLGRPAVARRQAGPLTVRAGRAPQASTGRPSVRRARRRRSQRRPSQPAGCAAAHRPGGAPGVCAPWTRASSEHMPFKSGHRRGRSRHWRRRCEQARPRTLRGGAAGSPRVRVGRSPG